MTDPAPPSGASDGPVPAAAIAEVAAFIARVSTAEELDERLELAGATGALRGVVDALNSFLDKLWAKEFQLSAKHEMLEKVVEIRTEEVREILDNVSAGFLLTRPDETVLPNFSRSCVDIFGVKDLRGRKLSELMGLDDRAAFGFSVFYRQIFEEFLPPEVAIGQLRTEFTVGARTFHIQGAPVLGKGGGVAKVFFTIQDTTELRKVEAENSLRQSLLEILRQKESFRTFLYETSQAFHEARSSTSQVRLRTLLHTTKGNLGCYGLHGIAALVHSIEDAPEITQGHLDSVEDAIKRFTDANHDVLELRYPPPRSAVQLVAVDRIRPLLDALVGEEGEGARRAAVDRFLETVTWVRAGALMAPLRGVVDRVRERLEKDVVLELAGEDVLVDPARVGPVFANLVHLVRNSLDHGIERPGERGAKPALARIVLACRDVPGEWVLEVRDDGRGIDADAVGAAAVARGRVTAEALAAMSRDQRLRLIFLDGLSTREAATEESGRGVGMTALLQSVEDLGGSVEIATTPGEGTRFTMHVPRGR